MLKHIRKRSRKAWDFCLRPPATLFVACLLSFASIASANAQDLDLTQAEKDFIESHPVIKVGGELDWRPFDFVNEQGQYVGIANDYLTAGDRPHRLRFEVEPHSFSELIRKLDEGEIDLLPALYYTEERDKTYNFSLKYHQVTEYFFARDDAGVSTADDLPGKTVAMLRGFASIETLRKAYPELTIIEFDSMDDAINAVVTYKADLLFDSLATLTHSLQYKSITTHSAGCLRSKDARPFRLVHGQSSKGMPELASIITKVIESTSAEEKEAILSRWLSLSRSSVAGDAGRANRVELTDAEEAWVQQHPVIRVHNEKAWPPYNFNVNGQPTGFSIDYMNLVAQQAGLSVEYITGPSWDEFKTMIQSDQLDVMLNMTDTPERREIANFTRPYAQISSAVIVKDPDLQVRSLDDLQGLRVAATRGFSTEEYFTENYPDIELVLEDSLLDTLYAVLEGRADATMDDFAALNYQMQRQGLPGLRVAYLSRDPELAESPAIGVRKDWPILRDILQQSMDSLDESDVQELRKKWLGVEQEAVAQEQTSNTTLWLLGSVLGVFVLLMLLNVVSRRFASDDDQVLQTGTRRFRILIFGSLSIFVVLIAIGGLIALDRIEEKILRDVKSNLENVLVTTTDRLDMWVEQQQGVLRQIAMNPVLIEQTQELLNVPTNSAALLEFGCIGCCS